MKYTLMILLVALVSCKKSADSSGHVTETSQTPIENTTQTWTEEFVELVNAHRVEIGLRPLIHREEMKSIAQTHSDEMADKSVAFGHDGFSTRCSEARSALGGGNWCGENVAMGQNSAQAVYTAWMNSPGHRANIESSRATHMGLAYAQSSSGIYYWTQLLLEL